MLNICSIFNLDPSVWQNVNQLFCFVVNPTVGILFLAYNPKFCFETLMSHNSMTFIS